MASAKQEAREAGLRALSQYRAAGFKAVAVAAATDGAEVVLVHARTLRDHTPVHYISDCPVRACTECAYLWPCPDWKRASEALDG